MVLMQASINFISPHPTATQLVAIAALIHEHVAVRQLVPVGFCGGNENVFYILQIQPPSLNVRDTQIGS